MRQLEHIMQKEMTRKEFLATLGFGIASVLGFSTVLKFILGKGERAKGASYGYGSNTYGR